jgi:hypothetical protein
MGTYTADQAAPGRSWRSVTPSDSTNLMAGCRAIWVGTAGNIALVGDDNTAITFTIASDGTLLPLGPKRVNSTNTTATNIVAIY